MTQKLTLEEWCNEVYPGKKPSRQTLQRWARNGNFYPAAVKEGREYRLIPGTIYINPKDLNLGRKIKEARSIEPARVAFMEKVINDTEKGGL
ncbi:excisionase [Serratia sp. PAMC26656]|uniref:excisionase n=1 Tax=Serratia sp. PAMC26656 TaxID=2775909 RepID=UPI0018F4E19C|nr:excisionase [Serratia sp. PAMC26656]MBJ7892495.1 excisionase [Serratia sp. PAMC26656]